jgi:hypothetical protein
VVLRDAGFIDLWPSIAALVVSSIVLVAWASRSINKVAQ